VQAHVGSRSGTFSGPFTSYLLDLSNFPPYARPVLEIATFAGLRKHLSGNKLRI
jgi:hypothetical protein